MSWVGGGDDDDYDDDDYDDGDNDDDDEVDDEAQARNFFLGRH